jgi:hypothetical protein
MLPTEDLILYAALGGVLVGIGFASLVFLSIGWFNRDGTDVTEHYEIQGTAEQTQRLRLASGWNHLDTTRRIQQRSVGMDRQRLRQRQNGLGHG